MFCSMWSFNRFQHPIQWMFSEVWYVVMYQTKLDLRCDFGPDVQSCKGRCFQVDHKVSTKFWTPQIIIDLCSCFKSIRPIKGVHCFHRCMSGRCHGVLIQDGKIIAYESHKLNDHEQRYSTYDLELTARVHAFKVWQHYLLGKKFFLMTYHSILTNLFYPTSFECSSSELDYFPEWIRLRY